MSKNVQIGNTIVVKPKEIQSKYSNDKDTLIHEVIISFNFLLNKY